jgi:hypothetical protein
VTGGAAGSVASGGSGGSGGEPSMLGPGCGFDEPAFCETFDQVASERGRAGDLDSRRWAAGRFMPQLPTVPGPFPIGPAPVLQGCQEGLTGSIVPPLDMLICASRPETGSPSLWISTAAQNYGINSVRIRQPIDFADRVGRIAFDAELSTPSLLYGFVSLSVTEDPVNAPSFAIDQNYEGGVVPRNGFGIQFAEPCAGATGAIVSSVTVYRDYVEEAHDTNSPCIAAERGQLSHVELEVSTSRIAVYASSPAQTPGMFEPPSLIQEVEVDLPITRGYMQLAVHNHATIKYTEGESVSLRAWTASFDNVGFDGPVLSGYREYEFPDSLDTVGVGTEEHTTIGHVLSGEETPKSFEFSGVETAGMTRARVAFDFWVLQFDLSAPALVYRWNGGEWMERPITDFEVNRDGKGWGAIGDALELPIADTLDGTNTLELATRGVGQSYPPAVANMDLVLTAE